MFTNPLMYKKIKKQKTTLTLYTERLVRDGLIPEGEIEDMKAAFQVHLNESSKRAKPTNPTRPTGWMASGPIWTSRRGIPARQTAIPRNLDEVGSALTRPDGFPCTKQWAVCWTPKRRCSKPAKASTGPPARRWPLAPSDRRLSACACPVRTRPAARSRQRHSGLVNQDTEERYYPLNHIREGQAHYEVIDSMLSEYAVLGLNMAIRWPSPTR